MSEDKHAVSDDKHAVSEVEDAGSEDESAVCDNESVVSDDERARFVPVPGWLRRGTIWLAASRTPAKRPAPLTSRRSSRVCEIADRSALTRF